METEGGHELSMLLNHCSLSQWFLLEQKNVSQQNDIKGPSEQLICWFVWFSFGYHKMIFYWNSLHPFLLLGVWLKDTWQRFRIFFYLSQNREIYSLTDWILSEFWKKNPKKQTSWSAPDTINIAKCEFEVTDKTLESTTTAEIRQIRKHTDRVRGMQTTALFSFFGARFWLY